MSNLFVRGSQSGDIFADSKVSGHYAIHLNCCCDIENPCEGIDLDDYVLDEETNEWSYHPVDGVCCYELENFNNGMDISQSSFFIVFEGIKVSASVFHIDDGSFAIPIKVIHVFTSLEELEKYLGVN